MVVIDALSNLSNASVITRFVPKGCPWGHSRGKERLKPLPTEVLVEKKNVS